jgi:cyclopropane-fatty-acyl-phospholipid synthase
VTAKTGAQPLRIPSAWHAAAAALLSGMRAGELVIDVPDGRQYRFGGANPGPVARMTVLHPSVARRVLTGGDIGLAEAYMDGFWDAPDLGAVLELALVNLTAGWAANVPLPRRPIDRLRHALRDNDLRGGSKRNISDHYDLGNDFYELWLDGTMTYSCACPDDDSAPLSGEELGRAQRRKWDRVLDLIQPGSRDHILEIGCGWGGFAVHAAEQAGCRVTGITLSEAQAELGRARVRERGLEGRVEIRLQDYRNVPETFSAISSIEMFEAVGERWWPVFFRRLREMLEPRHAAGLQVITVADDRFEHYRRHPDCIQRYIFPGGMLPSLKRFREVAGASRLAMGEPRFFGHDYARTLKAWSERFEAALPEVRKLGFDERFIRMWRYYLAYCHTGFKHGAVDVMQVRLVA